MKQIVMVVLAGCLLFGSLQTVAGKEPSSIVDVASTDSLKKLIYKEFEPTHLKGRIVHVRIRNAKNKIKVYLTWHPQKKTDIAKDIFVVAKAVHKVVPRFHSISLRALDPKSLRWTKRIFWDAIITRDALHFLKDGEQTGSDNPRPLFY